MLSGSVSHHHLHTKVRPSSGLKSVGAYRILCQREGETEAQRGEETCPWPPSGQWIRTWSFESGKPGRWKRLYLSSAPGTSPT